MESKSINLKLLIKIITFHLDFVLEVYENVYDFSFEYNFIDKSDILNIHKYLKIKNTIQNV